MGEGGDIKAPKTHSFVLVLAKDKIITMCPSFSSQGDNFIHVTNYSDVTQPVVVYHEALPAAGNDVELCGNVVGVALDGHPGTVGLYRLYDAQSGQLESLARITGKYGSPFVNRHHKLCNHCLNRIPFKIPKPILIATSQPILTQDVSD